MSFCRALQSLVFYLVSCTPCHHAKHQRKLNKWAKERQEQVDKAILERRGYQRQPAPCSTNPYWSEEISMGPHIDRKKHKSAAQPNLTSAADTSIRPPSNTRSVPPISTVNSDTSHGSWETVSTTSITTTGTAIPYTAEVATTAVTSAANTRTAKTRTSDAHTDETVIIHTRTTDARTAKTRTADAHTADARTAKTRIADARTDETVIVHTRATDAHIADAHTADAHTADARTDETIIAYTRTADARNAKTRTAETRTADTRIADARTAHLHPVLRSIAMTGATNIDAANTSTVNLTSTSPMNENEKPDVNNTTTNAPLPAIPDKAYRPISDTTATFPRNWNHKRYQREDEELWGHKFLDAIKHAGSSAGRLLETSLGGDAKHDDNDDEEHRYFIPANRPINDYHPPIARRPPFAGTVRWMVQPPPSAKVMEGKIPASRGCRPPISRGSSISNASQHTAASLV